MSSASKSDPDGFSTLVVAADRRRGPRQPAPEPQPAKEGNLARILRTRKLRLAGVVGEQVYFSRDPAGQWGGFCIEMGRNLATELGVELQIVQSSPSDAVRELQTGTIDLSYLSPNVERALAIDFTRSLFHDTLAVVARKGFAPKSWEELNVPLSRIAIEIGSSHERIARRAADNATITGFKTREEVLLAVQSSRADCLAATIFAALSALKKNPELGELIVPAPPVRVPVCAALPYDADRRFRDVVNAWCDDNRESGQIRKWILTALGKSGIEPAGFPPEVSF